MFVVPMATPGITVVPLKLIDGSVDFCQEYLDNVVIPVDNVIGEVDNGWRVATTLMVNERTAVGRGWSLGGAPGRDRGHRASSSTARSSSWPDRSGGWVTPTSVRSSARPGCCSVVQAPDREAGQRGHAPRAPFPAMPPPSSRA